MYVCICMYAHHPLEGGGTRWYSYMPCHDVASMAIARRYVYAPQPVGGRKMKAKDSSYGSVESRHPAMHAGEPEPGPGPSPTPNPTPTPTPLTLPSIPLYMQWSNSTTSSLTLTSEST